MMYLTIRLSARDIVGRVLCWLLLVTPFPASAHRPEFLPQQSFPLAAAAAGLVGADLDGDGDVDLVVAIPGNDEVSWLENEGGAPPTFTQRLITVSASGASAVAVADLNADGVQDVIAANSGAGELVWYNGTDGSSVRVIASHPGVNSAGTFDLDGDGHDVDVVAAAADGVYWYENGGGDPPDFTVHRIYETPPGRSARHAVVADIEGDGLPDVVSATFRPDGMAEEDSVIYWFKNLGGDPPTFEGLPRIVTTDPVLESVTSLTTADLDGDGAVDVLATRLTLEGRLPWWRNDGRSSPSFRQRSVQTSLAESETVYAADIDADADVDIVAGASLGPHVSWYANGLVDTFNEEFDEIVVDAITGEVSQVLAVDLDGDARLDLVVASDEEGVAVLGWYRNVEPEIGIDCSCQVRCPGGTFVFDALVNNRTGEELQLQVRAGPIPGVPGTPLLSQIEVPVGAESLRVVDELRVPPGVPSECSTVSLVATLSTMSGDTVDSAECELRFLSLTD